MFSQQMRCRYRWENTLLLILIGWWTPAPSVDGQRYGLLYGGVVGEQITNASVKDPDVAGAVKRLYFSLDEEVPFILQQMVTTSEGRVRMQRRQVVMGTLYLFAVTWSGQDCLCTEHSLTVTRDRNRAYHVYQHSRYGSVVDGWEEGVLTDGSIPSLKGRTSANVAHSPALELPFGVPREQYCRSDNAGVFGVHDVLNLGTRNLLHIATYNIWNVNCLPRDSYRERLRRLQKLIRAEEIDVFGFQEVRLDVGEVEPETECQVCQLSRYLPEYQFVYQPAMLHMDELFKRTEEGLAIFSKYPILSTDYILLYRNTSDEGDGHQRVCLHAEILTPYHGKVHVFVTHLSLSGDAQKKSVVQIWKYIRRFFGFKFLLGDLNAEPSSPTVRFLNGEVALEGVWTDGMHDAWTLGRTDPGYTYSALDKKQAKRIDYVFLHNPTNSGHHFHVLDTDLVGNSSLCDPPCSDHLGVKTAVTMVL